MADPHISIVLPVHNQASFIRTVVNEYETALAKLSQSHETLLIENGSRDDSLKICQELAEQYPSVKVISSKQGGWGLAVNLGVKAARGDLICYTNSARTSAPDLLLVVMYAIANADTVIKADRKIRENWRRRLGSLLYNLECRALFDLPYWDVNGTPKVFPRKFDKLVALTRNDDLIDVEFNAICRREGYPMLEVPILSTQRHGGKSTTRLKSALKMYVGAYRLWQEMGSSEDQTKRP